MTLVAQDLADLLKSSLGFGALATSSETVGLAEAIIEEIQAGTFAHAPGDVTGTAPSSGGPLQNGAASNGTVTGVTGASLANRMKDKMGKPSVTSELQSMADAIANEITAGKIEFATGNITGSCTNTTNNPGTLTGAGASGTITSLDGSRLATGMSAPYGSVSPELQQFCDSLTGYVMDNLEATYAMGSVTGTCSAGGGPIQQGTGTGGTMA